MHPALLKEAVTSPGGTSIAGVHAMERGGVRALLMDAIVAATERSAELGRQAGD
jgi:pyrroline-5-carboxylate reductase